MACSGSSSSTIDVGFGVLLPDVGKTQNMFGSQAAASLFAAADAASGIALINDVAATIDPLVAVVASATMRFRKPATGPILAFGRLLQPGPDVAELLDRDGRADVPVVAQLIDSRAVVVAEVEVGWRVLPAAAGVPPLWRSR